MKKLSIALNLMLIGIIVLQSFTQREKKVEYTSCYNCTDETKGQTIGHFLDVVSRYKTERLDLINKAKNSGEVLRMRAPVSGSLAPKTDSRAIWFSVDSLKKFICTIEKYSSRLQLGNDDIGVRMYYGVYDKDHKKFPNLHTIFIVPTYNRDGKDKPQVDFDPRINFYDHKTKGNLSTLSDIIKFKTQISLIMSGEYDDISGTIQNNGDLYPPRNPAGAIEY